MKVVIAIDSLKGSLSSLEAGNAIMEGIKRVHPVADIVVKPLADGGEGTAEALTAGLGGEPVTVQVTGPLGTPVTAHYGWLKESNTAVIEMASAAGITLLSENEKNPLITTTYGAGEMILDAINRGCRKFILGIGGSATNDGGIGMLQALGFKFFDKDGSDAGQGGQALAKITSISMTDVCPELKDCQFEVACDVTNPLLGPNGATYIYGPQKGVTEETRDILEEGMANYAHVTAAACGADYTLSPGAGAAGGLGFAFLSYLNSTLVPGVEMVLNCIQLEHEIKDADIVVTGEGRLDAQTVMGKAPIGVAKLAKKHHAKVIAFAGSVTEDATACNDAGIDAFFPILRGITTLEDALKPENARNNMIASVEQVFRLLSFTS